MAETAWSSNPHLRPGPLATERRKRSKPPFRTPYPGPAPERRHRTIFISDVHLGTRVARRSCWPISWQRILATRCFSWATSSMAGSSAALVLDRGPEPRGREILKKVDDGVRVVYVPGNHDEFPARLLRTQHRRHRGGSRSDPRNRRGPASFGAARRSVRRRYRLCQVARPCRRPRLQLRAGAQRPAPHPAPRPGPALLVALGLSQAQGQERRRICLALRGGGGARRGAERRRRCAMRPHHQAEMRRIGPILYLNDGDWVESCTALVEDARGHLEILRWASFTPASELARASAGTQGEAALIPA